MRVFEKGSGWDDRVNFVDDKNVKRKLSREEILSFCNVLAGAGNDVVRAGDGADLGTAPDAFCASIIFSRLLLW